VTLMGGTLDVRSHLGEGSTFSFSLPAAPPKGRGELEPPRALPVVRTEARILLVEDDRITGQVVQGLLSELGCKVDLAVDGREAVAAHATGRYDLIFLDCQMPVMDGYEAAARIRESEGEGVRIPIVAMTASVMRGQVERCRAAGMDDFLGKPFDLAGLQATLARWL